MKPALETRIAAVENAAKTALVEVCTAALTTLEDNVQRVADAGAAQQLPEDVEFALQIARQQLATTRRAIEKRSDMMLLMILNAVRIQDFLEGMCNQNGVDL